MKKTVKNKKTISKNKKATKRLRQNHSAKIEARNSPLTAAAVTAALLGAGIVARRYFASNTRGL